MKDIQMLKPTIYVHIMESNPKSWSRAFFQIGRGYDAINRSLYKSFNNAILNVRKKPKLACI